MEEKTKRFEELNKYERAMATATLEGKLEAMLREVQQMALALRIGITLDTTFYSWDDKDKTSGSVAFYNGVITKREVVNAGDLFGIIEEALAAKKED